MSEQEELIGGLLHDHMLMDYLHASQVAHLHLIIVSLSIVCAISTCGLIRWFYLGVILMWGFILGQAVLRAIRARAQWKAIEGKQFGGFVRPGPHEV